MNENEEYDIEIAPVLNLIIPNIYIGEQRAAHNIEILHQNKIKTIINCAPKSVKNKFIDNDEFVYLNVLLNQKGIQEFEDIDENKVIELFEGVYNIIEENSNDESSVLVHCVAGQDRSVTVLASYIMKKLNMPMFDTLELIKKSRKCAGITFFNALSFYEYYLNNNNNNNNEEEDEPIITKEGYLELKKKGKKSTKFIWFILTGSTLYTYGGQESTQLKKKYEIKDCTIEESNSRPFAFVIKKGKKDFLTLIGTSKNDQRNWISSIEGNLTKLPGPQPQRDKKAKKGGSKAFKAKKKVVTKFATSKGGKKLIKTAVNQETRDLLNALKAMIAKNVSSQKAHEIEQNILNTFTKAYVLDQHKQINIKEFLVADEPLRECFELLVKLRDYRDRIKPEIIEEKLIIVHDKLVIVEEILVNIFIDHLSSKSIQKIHSVFSLLSDPEFLSTAWHDDTIEEERDILCDAMNKYTQFHF
eukprot:TRINITY_DN5256_c1_g1_i1.p1 TRINITY_DN5256_c1_g1~~TRINITY_DN5256_c1_g1_i1.p1  ORF type:complete len:472 (+),score=132.71 TRINITY_DN5256_c1_g1_i1:159-1574(+)